MQIINYYYWAINLVTGRTETFYSKAKIEIGVEIKNEFGQPVYIIDWAANTINMA